MTQRAGGGPGGERSGSGAVRLIKGEDDFRTSVLESTVPVLVAFSAVWCAPCAWLEPYLEEIQRQGGERLHTAKVDVDRDQELARRYGVTSVPTVVHVRGGEEVARSLGIEPHRLRAMAFGAGEPEDEPAPG